MQYRYKNVIKANMDIAKLMVDQKWEPWRILLK